MTRIETVLSQLGTLGVRFHLEDDTLHYRAPKGALDAETIRMLKARKQEIIAFLRDNIAENGTRTMLPSLVARGQKTGPLSLGQQGLWVLYQLTGSNGTYNIPEALWLRGPLDRKALKKALQLLVDTHTVLRSSIRDNGKDASLYVAEDMAVDIPVINLRHHEPDKRTALALARANKEVNDPFNLQTGPLFRACLVQTDEQEHIFCLTLHHIIADGWSKGIMSRELAKAYNSFRLGKTPELDPLDVTYHDFVCWQREKLTDQFLAPHISYWRETLKDLPAPASIPTDRFRPEQPSGGGDVLRSELAPDLTRALKGMAREAGCTLYMVLATVFSELLRRYRNDTDIVFGTPSANRPFKELADLLGFFVNSLVIRIEADGRLSFDELLQRVRKTVLDSFAHQIVPFEKIVESLGQRSPSFSPLFQIGFVLQDGTIQLPELDGLQVEQIPVERRTAKYDISLIAVETGDRLVFEWEYATDLFERETIHHMAQSFAYLAGEAIRRPDTPLHYLDSCTTEQRALVIDSWSGLVQKTIPDGCLHDLFSVVAQQYSGRVAVVCGGRKLTYGELYERSDALAHHLQQVGCEPESIVAVCLDRSIELIVSILAILKAGGAYMPLDPGYPTGRLQAMLDDSGAQIVVAEGEQTSFEQAGLTVIDPCQHCSVENGGKFNQPMTRPDNLAYLIYTSGSTGTPKGVMIEHRSVVNLIGGLEETVYSRYPGPQQVSLFAATVFDASVQQIFAALCGGHTLHVLDTATREDHQRLLHYWQEEGITIADGTPTLLRLLLEAGLTEIHGLALKHLIIGGEPLPYETVKRLQRNSQGRAITLTNIYGPTECCVDVTAYTCLAGAVPELAVMPIGRPMVNARAYILDEQTLVVPPGMQGELFLGGPGVGRGYLGRDQLTAERFSPNLFTGEGRLYRTGDRVRSLGDGTIAFIGRTDNQLKVHGFRIEPGEIEHCLRSCEAVRDAVVDVVEQTAADVELVAYLVVDDENLTVKRLHGFLAERLPRYMIPTRFYTLPAFPRSVSGKVDRAVLSSLATVPLQKDTGNHCLPQTEQERVLAAVWCEVLNIEPPGIHDNYFVLGGDSIKALQIVSRLRKQKYHLAIKDIFTHPTIARQARLLETSSVNRSSRPVTGRFPLTAIQTWFMRQERMNRNHFHQAILLRPRTPLDETVLRRVLQALLTHHDALRSRFYRADTGKWVQEIMDPDFQVDFEVVDYSRESIPTKAIYTHSFELMQRTDLKEGSLFKAALYRTSEGERLLLTAHHLVVDGVSWRVLLQDTQLLYEQHISGDELDPGVKTTSWKEWSERLTEYGRSLPAEHTKMTGMEPDILENWLLPITESDFTYAERCRCQHRLSTELSKHLMTDAHQPYKTGITDLLLCGFGRAMHRAAGVDSLAITLEGHGREQLFEDVELDRTTGWFTIMFPVVMDLKSVSDVEGNIRSIQRTVQRAQSAGIEFGLRRWSGGNGSDTLHEPLPPILYNYLGDFDDMLDSDIFELADEKIGPVIDPEAVVPFALEVTGMSLGGCIELSIEYGPCVASEGIQTLMMYWAEELQVLVKHLSDAAEQSNGSTAVEYTGLAEDEVDSFFNTFIGN